MSIGVGRIVRQVSDRGVYAIVKVEASRVASGLKVSVAPAVEGTPLAAWYVPAVTFGIRYALEKAGLWKTGDSAAVEVLEITPLPVDTTEITMVYAAALATWDALQLQPERQIVLDLQTRSISFPI